MNHVSEVTQKIWTMCFLKVNDEVKHELLKKFKHLFQFWVNFTTLEIFAADSNLAGDDKMAAQALKTPLLHGLDTDTQGSPWPRRHRALARWRVLGHKRGGIASKMTHPWIVQTGHI